MGYINGYVVFFGNVILCSGWLGWFHIQRTCWKPARASIMMRNCASLFFRHWRKWSQSMSSLELK